MQCLVLFTFCFGLAVPLLAQSSSDPLDDPHWKAWKSFYGKNYGDFAEERIRNFIWQDNLKKITSDNEVHNNYKLAMNHLGDLVRSLFTKSCIMHNNLNKIIIYCPH